MITYPFIFYHCSVRRDGMIFLFPATSSGSAGETKRISGARNLSSLLHVSSEFRHAQKTSSRCPHQSDACTNLLAPFDVDEQQPLFGICITANMIPISQSAPTFNKNWRYLCFSIWDSSTSLTGKWQPTFSQLRTMASDLEALILISSIQLSTATHLQIWWHILPPDCTQKNL